jgi:ribosomal protein S18 acetylase RimI-like enzyme
MRWSLGRDERWRRRAPRRLGDNPTADIGRAAKAGLKTGWVNRYHRTWVGEGGAATHVRASGASNRLRGVRNVCHRGRPLLQREQTRLCRSRLPTSTTRVCPSCWPRPLAATGTALTTSSSNTRDPGLVLLHASIGGALVGVVGYTVKDTDVVVLHIATREDFCRSGVGRQMLQAVCEATPNHFRLVAETDSNAVGFYIANGFLAESVGEKYPGIERFHVHTLASRLPPRN